MAGVRPGKGGATHVGLPVFDTVRAASDETRADASLILVPPHQAAAAMIEAIEAELSLAVCVTERVPIHDMLRVKAALKGSRTELVGPNSQGVLAPGICKIGVMSTVDARARPGRCGLSLRFVDKRDRGTAQCRRAWAVNHGWCRGDPVHGVGFRRCLELFREDPDTEGVVIIGEPGGFEEEEAAELLAADGFGKPVVALVVGAHAPKERRMGHAGTLEVLGSGAVSEKVSRLAGAGAVIAANADAVAREMLHALRRG